MFSQGDAELDPDTHYVIPFRKGQAIQLGVGEPQVALASSGVLGRQEPPRPRSPSPGQPACHDRARGKYKTLVNWIHLGHPAWETLVSDLLQLSLRGSGGIQAGDVSVEFHV